MKIDKEILKHTADLAKLNLTDSEINEFLPQLKEILIYFEAISKLNTDNINPSFQPIELKNITRDDQPEKCLTQKQALSNTKNKKDGYFKGPRAV